MKKNIFLSLFLSISILTLFSQSPIIPAPVVYKVGDGTMYLGKQLSINEDNLSAEIKEFLVQKLVDVYQIQTVFSSSSKDLQFKKMFNTPPDYYSITINENILIQYSSDASCFYAVNSLFQLIEGEKNEYYFTKCFVQDYPKFQWRGMHLDVSRHFFIVDEVKRYIDLMSLYKFNTFHWHLTDDQGWRIEIKKYPKLTEVGAWRDSTLIGHYSKEPRTYSPEKYGGFYTQQEIKDVVEYAKNRFITVVPEIEMPGHSRAALAAYPYYSCTMEEMEVPGEWGVFDDIFCSKEETTDFLKDILEEVLELFPSEYIHIGGDEAPKARWKKCPRCQKMMRENGIMDEHALQSYFIQQMDTYLTSKGRKLIGWDEILEGGLSPNAAVMSWRGFDGGIEAVKQEHFVVMSPGSHCYFDHYQSTDPDEPIAIGGYTPLEKVYEFNPIPPGLTEQEAYYILGGQANLWTEYIPNMQQLEYMAYPRALALSQVLWCQNKPSYELFRKSLVDYHLDYLDRYKVNYSKSLFYSQMEVTPKEKGVQVHFKGSGDEYHYDLFVKSDEKVPTMHGGQIVTQKDSLYFEKTSGDKVVNYTFRLNSDHLKEAEVYKIMVHPSLNLPIELITQPSNRYSGKGSFTLSDGIIGSKPWKGNEWLGFDSKEIEFNMDLGKKSQIDSLEIGFLKDEGSWIYLPNRVQISVSKNGKKWKCVKNADIKLYSSDVRKGKYLPFATKIDRKARYIKFFITTFEVIPDGKPGEGNVPWTFLDELILFHK